MVHGEKVTATGAWRIRPEKFGRFRYNLDTKFADGLVKLVGEGGNMLDVGAGGGRYVSYLRSRNVRAEGVDGVPGIHNMTQGLVEQRELTKPFVPCREYRFVTCLEVGEHIPWKRQHVFLSNLNCSTHATNGTLILSWAPPGQFGSGHINNRLARELHWALTANHSCDGTRNFSGCALHAPRPGFGFRYDQTATKLLRWQTELNYMRTNLMVFRRRPRRSDGTFSPRESTPATGDTEKYWQRIRAGREPAP